MKQYLFMAVLAVSASSGLGSYYSPRRRDNYYAYQ